MRPLLYCNRRRKRRSLPGWSRPNEAPAGIAGKNTEAGIFSFEFGNDYIRTLEKPELFNKNCKYFIKSQILVKKLLIFCKQVYKIYLSTQG
jgi:hypothetical protein